MQTIKHIKAEYGEECKVDVDMLHDGLTKLPAEIYLKLFRKMQEKVFGYPPGFCGCGTPIIEEDTTEVKETSASQRLAEQCCCEIRQTPLKGE